MSVRRATVTIARDESSRAYLCGCEKASAKQANVFGNEKGKPLCRARNKCLYYEVEVQYCRSQAADEEYADVYRFRLFTWEISDGKPRAYLSDRFEEWQDFISPFHNHFPGFDALVNIAVDRIAGVRETRELFTPVLVGAPLPSAMLLPTLSDVGVKQAMKWIDDLEKRRNGKALERQLKRQKQALARAVIDGIGLGEKKLVGNAALEAATGALKALGLKQEWPDDKITRALLDLQRGFGYYQQELRGKKL